MSGQGPTYTTDSAGSGDHAGGPQGKEHDRAAIAREDKINALLEGTLDEASAEALKAAAAKNSVLAQAIVDARQLQKSMDQLQLEKAPASLRRKLRRIPHEHRAASHRPGLGLPRWVFAGGLASVVLIAVAMLMTEPAGLGVTNTQRAMSLSARDSARLEQTRRELAITFHYLDKIGLRVGREIREELNDELAAPVKDNFSKHMPYTGQSHKEKHA